MRIGKSRLGNKVYDFNTDGLAHYGMLPDLIADLEAQGLPIRELDPLLHSADGYVDAWERAWNNAAHLPAGQLRPPLRPAPSYGVVRPGAFCRAGTTGRSKHGVPMFCEQIVPFNIGRWKHIP